MSFRSVVVLHSKQANNVRMLALSERPKNVYSKDKSQKGKVRSQEWEQKHAYEKVLVIS